MVWAEIAHWMALIPLAWLAWLLFSKLPDERPDAGYWWIAGGFAVSFLADSAAHFVNPWAVTLVYPITQSTLIVAALLTRQSTMWLLLIQVGFAMIAIGLRGARGPDVLLHTAASFGVVWAVWSQAELPMRLRIALLVYFGVGLIAWWVHVRWLVVATWYPYQAARLAGLVLFCWATMRPGPSLRLVVP